MVCQWSEPLEAEQSMEAISAREIKEETDWIARLIAADGKDARLDSVSETTASPSVSALSNSLNAFALPQKNWSP